MSKSRQSPRKGKARIPLSPDAIISTGLRLADAHGLAIVTMRKIAEQLGVEAMSLYHHVPTKEAILDGMVDAVFAEVWLPGESGDGWQADMRTRAASMRDALRHHPWAIGLMDSRRNPGPATLRHHDAVIGCLRRAGFSIGRAASAFSVMDSYIYGFALQESSMPFDDTESARELAAAMSAAMPTETFPHLAEMAKHVAMQPDYDYGREFAFGLAIVLDGIARHTER